MNFIEYKFSMPQGFNPRTSAAAFGAVPNELKKRIGTAKAKILRKLQPVGLPASPIVR